MAEEKEYGKPEYGKPEYGKPPYGPPPYGQPPYGQPPYGKPGYGDYGYIPGDFEVEFPHPLLYGSIGMSYHEKDESPSRIIDVKDELLIKVVWDMDGSLVPYLCGDWCVQCYLECYGDCGQDLSLPAVNVPVDPCGNGHYETTLHVPPGTIVFKKYDCACPCKFVVCITYLTKCKDKYGKQKPGAIAGIVDGPVLQFYNMGEEVVTKKGIKQEE